MNTKAINDFFTLQIATCCKEGGFGQQKEEDLNRIWCNSQEPQGWLRPFAMDWKMMIAGSFSGNKNA